MSGRTSGGAWRESSVHSVIAAYFLVLSFSICPRSAKASEAEKDKAGTDASWELIEREAKDPVHSTLWANKLFLRALPPQWLAEINRKETERLNQTPPEVPVSTDALPSEGRIARVVDGDTLEIEGLGQVRLAGVDTPEKSHPTKPVQFLSEEATQFVKELAPQGTAIKIEAASDELRDIFGRLILVLYLPDGRMLNAEVVKAGYGIAFTRYPFKYETEFVGYMDEAIAQRKGLWAKSGLEEIEWLRAKGKEDQFVVTPLSYERWAVRYGKLLLAGLTQHQLLVELKWLRRDLYTFGPMDLDAELRRRGYQDDPGPGPESGEEGQPQANQS